MGRAIWQNSFRSSSCGCATIISNKGGLIETTDHAIILKNIDEIIYIKN